MAQGLLLPESREGKFPWMSETDTASLSARERDLYLDLLAKTLSFSLWDEPPWPLSRGNELRPFARRTAVSLLSHFLARLNLDIVKRVDVSPESRANGSARPLYGETMIGAKRLANIRYCVETILAENVTGDFIETGVWRGGACIFMRGVLAAHGRIDRKIFVADSFAGLPPPDPARFPDDAGDQHYTFDDLRVSLEEVKRNFKKYGLLDDHVIFLKGFFADTLPTAPIERLSLLRLDGDMYGSTMDALTNLYPKLEPGGFCIVDDYALDGARKAAMDFRAARSIDAEIIDIDGTGAFWRK